MNNIIYCDCEETCSLCASEGYMCENERISNKILEEQKERYSNFHKNFYKTAFVIFFIFVFLLITCSDIIN